MRFRVRIRVRVSFRVRDRDRVWDRASVRDRVRIVTGFLLFYSEIISVLPCWDMNTGVFYVKTHARSCHARIFRGPFSGYASHTRSHCLLFLPRGMIVFCYFLITS